MNISGEMMEEDQLPGALEEIYNLSNPIKCKFIRGSFNDHYSIDTNGSKFILRVYKNKKSYIRNITDIRFELDFLEYLHSSGIPVAYPIRSIKNETLNTVFCKNELRYIALFDYAEGSQIDNINISDAKIFGKLVATLHKRADQFKSEHSRFKIDQGYLINEPLETLEKYIGTLKLSDISFFKTRANLMHEHFDQLPSTNEAFGLIHGDLNPSNVHYCPEHGFKIFDFDHCAYGWRIHDLAVIRLCFDNNTYKAILNGYKSVRPLSSIEEKSIDMYSDVLLLRKSKDILDMLEVNTNSKEEKTEVVIKAIETLRMLNDRSLN
ncbi:phosphotransferase [Paenibacillus sp. LHD-38]|uniref:phosphotransferase n=1 Tax=Paenibacillus sp. LHD-38 TaxID=3072143 RepID=UPI00280F0D0B|nr:phosphotransferase [Paenibacillus sp. LHD-38]MDQ8738314.1 phosphotransferase [Paenibacillus sp. LHD-38]